jgi:hypothetical protein
LEKTVVVENYFAVRSFLIRRVAVDNVLHFTHGEMYRSQLGCCVLKSSLPFKMHTVYDWPTLSRNLNHRCWYLIILMYKN